MNKILITSLLMGVSILNASEYFENNGIFSIPSLSETNIKASMASMASDYSEFNSADQKTSNESSSFKIKGFEIDVNTKFSNISDINYYIGLEGSSMYGKSKGTIYSTNTDYTNDVNLKDLNLYIMGKTEINNFNIYSKIGIGYKLFDRDIIGMYSEKQNTLYTKINLGTSKEIYSDISIGLGGEIKLGINPTSEINSIATGVIKSSMSSFNTYAVSIPLNYKINKNLNLILDNKLEISEMGMGKDLILNTGLYRNKNDQMNVITKLGLNYNF